jgi:hypothetical protein
MTSSWRDVARDSPEIRGGRDMGDRPDDRQADRQLVEGILRQPAGVWGTVIANLGRQIAGGRRDLVPLYAALQLAHRELRLARQRERRQARKRRKALGGAAVGENITTPGPVGADTAAEAAEGDASVRD